MRSINQYSHTSFGQTFANAYRPGHCDGDVFAPVLTGKSDWLTRANAIVAISEHAMLEHCASVQLYRGVLLSWWKCGQTLGVRSFRDHPALGQVGSLLEPTTK